MYGIQATAEVDIGSSLHVPEVPPDWSQTLHCYNPCHYGELCSHYSSRHFVWTEHENMRTWPCYQYHHQYFTQQHQSTNCVFAVRAQCQSQGLPVMCDCKEKCVLHLVNHSSLYMICPQWPTCVWSSNCVQSSEIQPSDDRDDVTTISGAGKQKLSIFQTSEPHLLWQPSTLTYCHKEIELYSSSWHTFVLQCIHQIHQIHC